MNHYYHYYHLFFFDSFSLERELMVSHWSLRDKKPLQVSWTLLSILDDLNYEVVWMVSTRSVISKSSCPCSNPLVTVPRAPITIGITANFIFHGFFDFPVRSWYLSLFSHSFNFTLWFTGTAKSTIPPPLSLFVDCHKI